MPGTQARASAARRSAGAGGGAASTTRSDPWSRTLRQLRAVGGSLRGGAEGEELRPPGGGERLEPRASGGADREGGEGPLRLDGGDVVLAEEVGLREDDAVRLGGELLG